MKKYSKKIRKDNFRTESIMASSLDALAEFEEFKRKVLPMLREEINKGTSAEEIYKKFSNLAAARAVTIALTDADASKAMRAVQEILDRGTGRPTEKNEVTHKYANVSTEDLRAMVKTKLLESRGEDSED